MPKDDNTARCECKSCKYPKALFEKMNMYLVTIEEPKQHKILVCPDCFDLLMEEMEKIVDLADADDNIDTDDRQDIVNMFLPICEEEKGE